MRKPLALLLTLAAVLAVLYLAALGWLWLRQEKILFQPQVLPADHRFAFGADVRERTLEVPGATLSALHLKLPQPRGLVFFLHGNAGSLDSWFVNTDFYRQAGWDLFMLDYRGYGKSTGRIESEAQLHADVAAAWARIAPEYRGLPIIIYGRSLGTGLAAALAAREKPALTVLVAPYAGMVRLLGEHYPLVPGALLRYRLDTAAAVARLESPLLLIHGERDTLIAPAHSEALLERAAPAARARLLRMPDAAHNDVHQFPLYRQRLREAMDAAATATPIAPTTKNGPPT